MFLKYLFELNFSLSVLFLSPSHGGSNFICTNYNLSLIIISAGGILVPLGLSVLKEIIKMQKSYW
jgi:hypothetical protein